MAELGFRYPVAAASRYVNRVRETYGSGQTFALTDRMTRQFVEENSQQLDGPRQLTATAIQNVVDATPG